MPMHDDHKARPAKRTGKVVPPSQRTCLKDCEFGDRVRFQDGTEALVTTRINGVEFGRMIGENGDIGRELVKLPADQALVRIGGFR